MGAALWITALAISLISTGFWMTYSAFRNTKKRGPESPPARDNSTAGHGSASSGAQEDGAPLVLCMASLPAVCAKLPPQQPALEWRGVSSSVGRTAKAVLSSVSGAAYAGELQALLGPSGAGKSTLLDVLAMRKTVGALSGQLLAAGRPASRALALAAAYVPQEDNFQAVMTARETLQLHARLLLPAGTSAARRAQRVAEVLAAVGLSGSADTQVGGVLPGGLLLRGLSGGERRRLSIAVGILACPSVLFLDEPTSGLDSWAALRVMELLAALARGAGADGAAATVIASIHQPRCAIWQLFDRVTLLSGGRLMFHGPRDGLAPWFATLGYCHDRAGSTVADWALDLVAVGFDCDKPAAWGNTMRTWQQLADAADAFAASAPVLAEPVAAEALPGAPGVGKEPVARCGGGCWRRWRQRRADTPRRHAAGFSAQTWALMWREALVMCRNPFDMAGRSLIFTMIGVLVGLLFYGTPADASGVRARCNLGFIVLQTIMLLPCVCVCICLFSHDKRTYLADASARLYRPAAYYVAKVAVVTPAQVLSVVCCALIVHGMAGLRPGAEHAARFGTVVCAAYLIGCQVLHLCSVVAPNQDLTFMLFLCWASLQVLLSGFVVPLREITANPWLRGGHYLSALYYCIEAFMVNEFKGLTFDCSTGAALAPPLRDALLASLHGVRMDVLVQQLSQPRAGCQLDSGALLAYFGFEHSSFGRSLLTLGAYWAAAHVATFAALRLVARREAR